MKAASTRRGKSNPSRSPIAHHHGVAPPEQFVVQHRERRLVRLPPSPDDQIRRRLPPLNLAAPNLPQPAPQTIAGHRGRPELRYDQSQSRMARRVVRPNHVQMFEAAAPPFGEALANVVGTREAANSRKPSRLGACRCRQEPPCFEGRRTVNCLRPFFRRRDSTARPHRVAMRARNPCLLIRRLLRGRYDGFIGIHLQNEPGNVVSRPATVKLRPWHIDGRERRVRDVAETGCGVEIAALTSRVSTFCIVARIVLDFSTPDP